MAGYLVCGCCGHKLTKGRPTNKNWLCATARYTDETACKNIRLNEETMKEKLISAIQLQCKLADASIEASRANQSKDIAALDSLKWELRKAERTLDEGKNALMSLMDDYYDSKITKDQFMEKKSLIKNEETKLISRIDDLKAQMAVVKSNISNQLGKESDAGRVVKHKGIDHLDEDIMRELVEKIVIYPENIAEISWSFAN